MKIKIVKNTAASGKPLKAGSVAEVSDKDAKILISLGKAIPFDGKEEQKQEPEIDNRQSNGPSRNIDQPSKSK